MGRAWALESEGAQSAIEPWATHLTPVSPISTLKLEPSAHLGTGGGAQGEVSEIMHLAQHLTLSRCSINTPIHLGV